MTIVLLPVMEELPAGFDVLRSDARDEGHTNMERLADDWISGANRFSSAGEALFAAFITNELTGVGGITRDPACPAALRLRRFYVRPAFRRHGVGRLLAHALIQKSCPLNKRLVLNAETDLAVHFWQALGFAEDRRDGHTHIWP